MGLKTEMMLLAEAEAQERRIDGLERKLDQANLHIAKLSGELEAKTRELAAMQNGHGNPWYRPFYRTKGA